MRLPLVVIAMSLLCDAIRSQSRSDGEYAGRNFHAFDVQAFRASPENPPSHILWRQLFDSLTFP